MAAFTQEEISENLYVYCMFRDGALAVVPPSRIGRLLELTLGYTHLHVDCSRQDVRLEHQLREVFALGKGSGLDAFNSQFRDFEFPDSLGVIVHFENATEEREQLWDLLDILLGRARELMLEGRRLLLVLPTNDRPFLKRDLGAVNAVKSFV